MKVRSAWGMAPPISMVLPITFNNQLIMNLAWALHRVACHLYDATLKGNHMTPCQIQLVQSTWMQVVPIAETAANLFYGKLFELDPAVKPMFKGDMAEQGRKLMKTIGMVVNSLTRLEEMMPTVPGRRRLRGDADERRHPGDRPLLQTAHLRARSQGRGPGAGEGGREMKNLVSRIFSRRLGKAQRAQQPATLLGTLRFAQPTALGHTK